MRHPHTAVICVSAVLLGLAMGCTHLGDPYQVADLPPGAPTPEAVLADLAANDAAISSFFARGEFTLKTPELDTIYLLRHSDIVFQRPVGLHVVGRKFGGHTMLRLSCAGPAFLMEFPFDREFIFRPEGEYFESAGFGVSPVDIVRELFLPEDWAALPSKRLRVVGYDEAAQQAELLILDTKQSRRPVRRIIVQGAPWVVIRNERLDPEKGESLAITTHAEFREQDGIRFPTQLESEFPGEEAFMRFSIRRLRLNQGETSLLQSPAARASELRRKGYQEIEAATAAGDGS